MYLHVNNYSIVKNMYAPKGNEILPPCVLGFDDFCLPIFRVRGFLVPEKPGKKAKGGPCYRPDMAHPKDKIAMADWFHRMYLSKFFEKKAC